MRRAGGAQERLLHQVAGVLAAAGEPPRQPEQPRLMGVEERANRAPGSSSGRSDAAASTSA